MGPGDVFPQVLRARLGCAAPEDAAPPQKRGDRMIQRRKPIPRSTKRIPQRRAKARRGRLVDPEYLSWLYGQPGAVFGGKTATVHHVRDYGSPKDDHQTLPLEFGYHTYQEGPDSIECLGKRRWQETHGVDIEAAITRYQRRYLASHPSAGWDGRMKATGDQ